MQVSQCQCHCHPFSISVSAGNIPRFFRLLSYGLKRLSLPPVARRPLLPSPLPPLVVVLVLFHSNTGNGWCVPVCACAAGAKIKTHAHGARDGQTEAPLIPMRNATVLTVTMVICSSLSAAPRKIFISRMAEVYHSYIEPCYLYVLAFGCERLLVLGCSGFLVWLLMLG